MFWDIFTSILLLLTGIGVFMVGIIKFSNILQAGNNEKIKNYFDKMGNNRFVNFGVGAGTTVLIQSSTATTVIVVGLVNAGLMNLGQATAVIFGANVGTSISNIILALSTFRIRYIFMSFVFFGAAVKLFTKNPKLGKFCDVLMSVGIMFVGLYLMSSAFTSTAHLSNAFESLFETVTFPLALIALAFVLTAIMQSSTAASAIFITMAMNGVIGMATIFYLVIGTKLGTTLTTLLASIGASKNAKRAALVHFFVNLFGATLFLIVVWPLESQLAAAFASIPPEWKVVVFGLIYSFTTAAILLFFIKPLDKLVNVIIKDTPVPAVETVQLLEKHRLAAGAGVDTVILAPGEEPEVLEELPEEIVKTTVEIEAKGCTEKDLQDIICSLENKMKIKGKIKEITITECGEVHEQDVKEDEDPEGTYRGFSTKF